jgi:hypothetical protein
VTGEKQDNNTNTKKQKHPKTSCWQWRRRPKTPDGSAYRTCTVTRTTQTKIRRHRTCCHRARLEKDEVWPSRAPRSRELPGAWAPRAYHRRLTRPEFAAAGAEDGGERGWGRVSTRIRRRSVDLASKINEKKCEKNLPKIIPSTTRWIGHSLIEDILR